MRFFASLGNLYAENRINNNFMIRSTFFFILTFLSFSVYAQQSRDVVKFINTEHAWVDSVFNSLSPKERIAQLFLVRAQTNMGDQYVDSVAKVLEREQLGGIVLFQGGPVKHANLINRYNQITKVPLIVAFDGEWGLGMRLPDSTQSYPYQMTLGAIQNEALIYQMGREIAKDFRRLGVNFNFAPVIDINNNPKNPVIGFRSFGEDKENVTRKGLEYSKGMMDGGILVSLKHFPGHGDTDVDSHYDLPVLNFDQNRLDSLEIFPFKELVNAGVVGVMVAHMQIPSLDPTPNLPSSLSKPIVTGILREKLGFQGLVVTDAMEMQGVTKYFKDGEADVRAIIAGADLLELSENSERAINLVIKAVNDGRLDQADLDKRVKRVLASKYWLNLHKSNPVDTANLYKDLNRPTSKQLIDRLANSSVTMLNSDKITNLDFTKKTAIIGIGETNLTVFQKNAARKFNNSLFFVLPKDPTEEELEEVIKELDKFDQYVISIHDTRSRPRSELDFQSNLIFLISELANRNSVLVAFTNPYALAGLPGIEKAPSILLCYQNDGFMQKAAARVISKTIKPSGKLPVNINSFFKLGDGIR